LLTTDGYKMDILSKNYILQTIKDLTILFFTVSQNWNINHSEFNDTETIVKESWASGVEWALTRLAYPNYSINYFTSTGSDYTRVVVDLIDGTTSGYDKVTGYTIRQLEDAIIKANTFNEWRDNIKKINNATSHEVDNLFNYWD
jgi:hypothetical protein